MSEKDISEQEEQRVTMCDSRRKIALDAARIGVWELDLGTGITRRSLRHDQCFGYDVLLPEWTYAIFRQHVYPADRDRVERAFESAVATGDLYETEFRVVWPDGSLHWLLSRAHVFRDADGKATTISGVQIDITAQKLAQEKLASLTVIVEKITTPVLTTDNFGNIDWANDAFLDMTGYELNEVLGQHPGRLLQGKESSEATIDLMRQAKRDQCSFEVDILNYRKNGEPFWQHIKADPIAGDATLSSRYIAVQSDITKRKLMESELWTSANFDGLTLLPNRRLFWDRLNNAMHHPRRTGAVIGLLVIDLDRFKEINDLYGHDSGDGVLQQIAGRINQCLRASDTAARLGGDEFAVILTGLDDGVNVDQVARKLLDAILQPIVLPGVQCTISASIGIALFPADASDAQQLLRDADQAMYLAKGSGRNRFAYFTPSMQERSDRRLRIGRDLRHAVARHQLLVYFQPIVDLTNNAIVKGEALLRWSHPELGAIAPAEFIPLAEELGLIDEIGEWVFSEAAQWSATWSAQCLRPVQVSVNKSALQFSKRQQRASWPQLLKKWQIPCRQVSVEITEGVLLTDSESVMETLAEYRGAGIEIALDDFGTGYSSMAYLKKFNIDYLKIDQSFIRDIDAEQSRTITEAIIVMGHQLGLKIIAEGIETEQQRNILMVAGCDFGQGYLFSHALPPEEFGVLLDHRAAHSW
jgi:diguanylate cyclase (GGDEF)-like protein/PAS domain S-box-containing protein